MNQMNRIFRTLIQNLQAQYFLIQAGFGPIRAIHEWAEGILTTDELCERLLVSALQRCLLEPTMHGLL